MLRIRLKWRRLITLIALSATIAVVVFPAESHADLFLFLSPGEGAEVTTSKPPILCETTLPESSENLLVVLDDTDITGALDFSTKGFRFNPVQPLANGPHQLRISATVADGSFVEQEFTFHTFSQLSSDTQASVIYEHVIEKSDELDSIPDDNFSSNLTNVTTYNQGNWQIGVATTNIRLLERSSPVFEPEDNGLDVINYVVTGKYQDDDVTLQINAGDLQIQETTNTLMGLSRRGVQAGIESKGLSLDGFVVQSEQLYGVTDGSGLSFNGSKYIKGVSGGYSLLDNTLNFRMLYISGVESNNTSYGIYDTDKSRREGDIIGFVVQSDLWDGKLNLEAEYDISDYDANTSDDLSSESDKAWALTAGGYAGSYSYQAVYEYVGPQYAVIGNSWLQSDREGFAAMGGVQKPTYSLNLSASSYVDNVDENKLYSQVKAQIFKGEYAYTRFPDVPIRLSYQKSTYESSMVPQAELPYHLDTDLYSAWVSYLYGPWAWSVNASYTTQDDKTETNFDTTAQIYGISTTYYAEAISIAQNLTFDRTTNKIYDIDTDNLIATIDLTGNLYRGRVLYGMAGTFIRTTTSDDTLDTNAINANGIVSYLFQQEWAGSLNPSIGIRGSYDWLDDRILGQDEDSFSLMLVFSSSFGYAF